MPEWQGAGVGTKFLDFICQWHLDGNGTGGHRYPTLFHTSHPQLCGALRRSRKWAQVSAVLYGANKTRCHESLNRTGNRSFISGYGGHFRAVQGFKYLGPRKEVNAK
jgi:hypothetical protein